MNRPPKGDKTMVILRRVAKIGNPLATLCGGLNEKHKGYPDTDGGIRDIKRWPMIHPDIEIEKVDHRAESHAINHISDRSSKDSGKRYLCHR
jgi:hypothetical protein